jgi:transposase
MQQITEKQQRIIFQMIRDGYTAKDIADQLCLSIGTIYNYARQYQTVHKELICNGKFLKKFGFRK